MARHLYHNHEMDRKETVIRKNLKMTNTEFKFPYEKELKGQFLRADL